MTTDTIIVKVLFFGAATDAAGKREANLEIPIGTNSKDALEKIITEHPVMYELKNSLMFAVNQEYANGNEILRDGDEIAIIPPVSGG